MYRSLTPLFRRQIVPSIFFSSSQKVTIMVEQTEAEASFEDSVGIRAFTNTCTGVTGILKQRFSDFIVREVTTEDEVICLKSTAHISPDPTMPPDVAIVNSSSSSSSSCSSSSSSSNSSSSSSSSCSKATPAETADKLLRDISEARTKAGAAMPDKAELAQFKAFIVACIDKEAEDAADVTEYIGFPTTDKGLRTAMHQVTKQHVAAHVETEAMPVDGVTHIRFVMKQKKGQAAHSNQVVKRSKFGWPKDVGDFLQFTLLKENIDTMSAISLLSKGLHCKPNDVQYNGTKDKRGVTAQVCTVYRRKPRDFDWVNNFIHPPHIRVGDFKYVDKPAKLGMASGNLFEITLRNVKGLQVHEIVAACEGLRRTGFINYYGLQRFGKGGSKSHDIGRACLKENWQACVDMLFADRVGDQDTFVKAKRLYNEGKYAECLRAMPDRMYSEKIVVAKLAKEPKDLLGAYNAMPKNTRLICVHAYQSYIWNMAATRRIELHGTEPAVGDLVARHGAHVELETSDPDAPLAESVGGAGAGAGSGSGGGGGGDGGRDAYQNASFAKSHSSSLHCLTQEDIDLKTYSISDVLLPLPGYASVLPSNEIGAYITSLLAVDGVSLETYSTCNLTYRMSGAYRHLIQFPKNFDFRVVKYSQPQEEIASTELATFMVPKENKRDKRDKERKEKKQNEGQVDDAAAAVVEMSEDQPSSSNSSSSSSSSSSNSSNSSNSSSSAEVKEAAPAVVEAAPIPAAEGQYTAVVFKFMLPPGTYATMLLRELTKESTETQFQAQLTSVHESGPAVGSKRPAADQAMPSELLKKKEST